MSKQTRKKATHLTDITPAVTPSADGQVLRVPKEDAAVHVVNQLRRAARPALVLCCLAVCGGFLMLLGGASASAADIAPAHENTLTGSQPAASATLTVPPERITLRFRWRIRPGSMAVIVVGPDGVSQWQQGPPRELGNTVGVEVRRLAATGDYRVHYQGVSLRGHPFHGMMGFVLAPELPVVGGEVRIPPIWIAGTVLLTAFAAAVGIRLGRTGLPGNDEGR